MKSRLSSAARDGWLLGLVLSACLTGITLASDLKVEGRLVWGTNDKTSPNPKHKQVDEATRRNLRKALKWTNYFEVNRQVIVVPSRGTNSMAMSKECVVEVQELQGPSVKVRLIGKGTPWVQVTKDLSPGESIVLAGEDKHDTAWFVIITELEEIHVPVKPVAPVAKTNAPAKK